jgi:hypothetical protein
MAGEKKGVIEQARRALREAEAAYRKAVSAARDELSRIEADRRRALDEARRRVRDEESAFDRTVQAEEARLSKARSGELLGSYGSQVRLFSNRLEAPEGVIELSPQIRASVEATGTKSEKLDTREVVLLLDTPKFDSVIRINPDHATSARELAAKINTTAKNSTELLRVHSQAVSDARRRVDEARSDRAAITSAQRGLSKVETDLVALEAARAAVRQAEDDTEELEAKRSELLALDPSARVRETAVLQRSLGHPIRAWW